jgi:hypothetical protein
MTSSCALCTEPTTVRVIGAMIITGNVEHPDGALICRRCAALSADEQERRRDQAMARMLVADTGLRAARRASSE